MPRARALSRRSVYRGSFWDADSAEMSTSRSRSAGSSGAAHPVAIAKPTMSAVKPRNSCCRSMAISFGLSVATRAIARVHPTDFDADQPAHQPAARKHSLLARAPGSSAGSEVVSRRWAWRPQHHMSVSASQHSRGKTQMIKLR